jgi:cytochrome c553
MPPKKETQLTDAEIQALAAFVRGLSPGSASAKPQKPAAVASAGNEKSSEAASSLDAPSTASGEPPAAAPTAGAETTPETASTEPETEGPPDEALLARVPPRIALYEDAVAPLLSKRCSKCHSGEKPAARLRVDDYATLVEGGLSGPGIVPGKPDDSFVCQRIRLPPTHDDRMPPEDEPPMTKDEVALVVFWVESGASRDGSLPAKDVPAPALRAAAEFARPGDEPRALGADAGCAACAVGGSPGSNPGAAMLAGLALGTLLLRRGSRRCQVARRVGVRGTRVFA